MDAIDLKILGLLQENAMTPLAEISDKVGLSVTPCWRRIQQLEQQGYIRQRVALLDPEKLNVGVTVFMAIRTNQHNDKWLRQFSAAVKTIPQVVELYRMSGDIDYLLRIVVPDIKAYDEVYKRLIRAVDLSDVSSSFSMECIKYTTALPLNYA